MCTSKDLSLSPQYLLNMNRSNYRQSENRRSPHPPERRKDESERVYQRPDASDTNDDAYYDWNNRGLSNTISNQSRQSGRNYSHVGMHNSSVAAKARQDVYAAKPRMQSAFKIGSQVSRDHDAGHFSGQPSKGVRLPKEAYKLGMIIRAVIHEPNLDRNFRSSSITNTTDFPVETKYGLVTSKMRKLIVIGLYQDHYMAVPLYTHNGLGLKRKLKPEEYVSVQDHRRTEPFTALSVHDPLVTEHLNPDIFPYDPMTTAHIPYMVSRGYILPVVYEGNLEQDSTTRLLRLIGTYWIPSLFPDEITLPLMKNPKRTKLRR